MSKKLASILLRVLGCVLLTLLAGMTFSIRAYATPSCPHPQLFHQADGYTFTGYMRGDEFFSWFEDEYEHIIAYDDQKKSWCYAYVEDNALLPSSKVIGKTDIHLSKDTLIQRNDILDIIENNIKTSSLHTSWKTKTNKKTKHSARESTTNTQQQPKTMQQLLLVLVEFNNSKIQNSGIYWSNQYFINKGNNKTVAQYYKDMSGGLDIIVPADTAYLDFESIGPVNVTYKSSNENIPNFDWAEGGVNATISYECDGVLKVIFDMPHPISIYTGDRIDQMKEIILATLTMKAIKECTEYDFTGFGTSKQVAIIVAGAERSCNMLPEGVVGEVWANSSSFDNSVIGVPSITGILGEGMPYMMHGEIDCKDEKTGEYIPTVIGVMCHELGHVLGLPDLYNTRKRAEGIAYYSVMAYGNWGRSKSTELLGTTPVALDAWSKYVLGYVIPTECEAKIYDTLEVRSAGEITENSNRTFSDKYNVIKLTNEAIDKKQYFLIENRQNEGWDAGMFANFRGSPFGGILILQIDENIPMDHTINAFDAHRGVDIVASPKGGAAKGNYFYAAGETRDSMIPDKHLAQKPNSNFYLNASSNPEINTRSNPSQIYVYVLDECSNRMEVKVGIDSDITEEFVDANFLAEVRRLLAKDFDAGIYKSDLAVIKSFRVPFKSIKSFNGIEYFRKLESFCCYYNNFQSLDLSGNPDLRELDCSHNPDMVALDVSKNVKLESLDCNDTGLQSLVVRFNPNLTSIVCNENSLEEIDLSNNGKLQSLSAWGNQLTSLDVRHNPSLSYLDCGLNNMSSPDDVIGWREIGLVLEENFFFDPQNEG